MRFIKRQEINNGRQDDNSTLGDLYLERERQQRHDSIVRDSVPDVQSAAHDQASNSNKKRLAKIGLASIIVGIVVLLSIVIALAATKGGKKLRGGNPTANESITQMNGAATDAPDTEALPDWTPSVAPTTLTSVAGTATAALTFSGTEAWWGT